MNWRNILKKLHPSNILDCIVNMIVELMGTWVIIRVSLILLLVVATITSDAINNIGR